MPDDSINLPIILETFQQTRGKGHQRGKAASYKIALAILFLQLFNIIVNRFQTAAAF
jgi:hypothetical protein